MTKNISEATFLKLLENIKLFSGDDLTQIAFDSKYRNVFLSITGYEEDNYKLVIDELYNTNLKKEMSLTSRMKEILQSIILNEVKRQEKNIKDEAQDIELDYEQFN
jgi:hypothetical protein